MNTKMLAHVIESNEEFELKKGQAFEVVKEFTFNGTTPWLLLRGTYGVLFEKPKRFFTLTVSEIE